MHLHKNKHMCNITTRWRLSCRAPANAENHSILKQGNHRCQTSPVLCAPITHFPDDRLHCMRTEFSRFLYALAWQTERSILLHDVTGDWMIPSAANVAVTAAAKIADAFEWPGEPNNSRKLPLTVGGSVLPSNTWFLGRPTRVFVQNSMSIGSAVFAQLTAVAHYFTIRR